MLWRGSLLCTGTSRPDIRRTCWKGNLEITCWQAVLLPETYPKEGKIRKDQEHPHSLWFGNRTFWHHMATGKPFPCPCRVRTPNDKYQSLRGTWTHVPSPSHKCLPTSTQSPLPASLMTGHRRATGVPVVRADLGSWPAAGLGWAEDSREWTEGFRSSLSVPNQSIHSVNYPTSLNRLLGIYLL